ncbi:hypothetical protein, partial [Streptococcus pneumoniae]|uniref:hypothetical protein n=1 Tax=Streptococcus pneumoniae TaxID=1313 RepID=UPI001D0CA19A
AGKQLEKVLKSIERQLFKLVLSHAFNLASLSVRLVLTRKKLYKKQPFKIPTLRSLATESMRHVTGKTV